MLWHWNSLERIFSSWTVSLTRSSPDSPHSQGVLDSIVRGTTSKEIVQMAKDVGAKNVIVASCAPPIRFVPFK